MNRLVTTNGRTFDVKEGPIVPLLDVNSVLRFAEKTSLKDETDARLVRREIRPLIHWATRNQDRHRVIGRKWSKFN